MIVVTLMSTLLAAGAVDSYDDEYDTRPILTLDDVTYKSHWYMTSVYPEAALSRRLEGEATVVCHIRRNGSLTDCSTESEAPANSGFGAATAQHFIRSLRIGPATRTGEATAGRRIRLSYKWRIKGRFRGQPPD